MTPNPTYNYEAYENCGAPSLSMRFYWDYSMSMISNVVKRKVGRTTGTYSLR